MNLSLYKLRKKLNTDKSGQSSLVGVILASVIGTVIVGSLTQWYLSMHKNIDGLDDRLESMTIALSEWERLQHMSLEELEGNRTNYQTPWNVGDKYKVSVELGEQGTFDKGKCNALTGEYAGDTPNCFRDTIMKVYDSTTNNVLYTTRSLPLTASGGITMKYDAESDSVKVYVNGQEKPIDLHNRYVRNPDRGTRILMKEGSNFTAIVPFDGFLEMNYSACCCSTYVYLNDNLVAGTYNSETTNRSQADTTFIHVKAGDKIRAETYSYQHANTNTVRLYMYNYIK